MSPERIGLEAVLIDDSFTAGVKSYNAGIDSMESANKDAVKSSAQLSTGLEKTDAVMQESGGSAVELAAKIDIAKTAFSAAQNIISTGLGLAKLGAQSQRVEKRFGAFAEEAGGANAILQAFQTGAGGAASKMESMTTASRLLQMGLVEDAAGMERVVEMSTRLGDQTQGVTDRVSDFALMLANQSIPRLDNFGISSGRVRERIAELTTGTNALSREAAFMQATMEQGALSLDKLGPRTEDGLMAFERMEAQLADLKVEIGQGLVPAFSALLGITGDVLGTIAPLVDVFSEVAAGTDRMKAAVDETNVAATSMGQQVADLVAGGMSLADATAVATGKINESSEAWNNANAAQKAAIGLLGKGSAFTDAMSTATGSLSGVILDNAGSFAEYTSVIDTHNATITDSAAQITALSESQFELRKSIQATQEGWAALTEGERQSQLAIIDQMNAYAGLTQEQRSHQAALESVSASRANSISSIRDADTAMRDLARSTGGLGPEMHNAQTAMQGASAETRAMGESMQATAAAEQEAASAAEVAAMATDNLGVATSALTAAEQAGLITAAQRTAMENALAIALGTTTQAEINAQGATILVAQAYAIGKISALEYASAVASIHDGTFEVTDAERTEIETSYALAAAVEFKTGASGGYSGALRDERSALEDSIISHHTLAEQMMNPQPNQIAKRGIDNLKKAYQDGNISFAEYESGLIQMQDTFELVTPESRDLANAISMLDNAMVKGALPADQYDDALKQVLERAEEGTVDVQALFAELGIPIDTGEVDEFGNAIEGIQSPIEEAKNKLMELPQTLDTVDAAFGVAGSTMVESMQAGFEQAWPGMIDTVTSNMDGLANDLTSGASGGSSNGGGGSDIPGMQSGGQLGGSPSQSMLVRGHGGERFVPEGLVADPFGPPRAPTSAPAVGAFGRTTNTSTTTITERAGDTITIEVPNMLAANMLADSMRQQRKTRAGM